MDKIALNDIARTLYERALAHCSIEEAFARKVVFTADQHGSKLVINGENVVDCGHIRRLRIVAVGKASATMLDALLSRLQLPVACEVEGVLIGRERPRELGEGFLFFSGGHPFPTEGSFAGARAALGMMRAVGGSEDALCIFLVSGGGSAMMELPLDPGITLEDTVAFHRGLVHSGATIAEINCVRKHFSAVKGGRLALAAGGVASVSLLVSDVPRGHLDALASGPTVPDSSTVEQCLEILDRYKMLERFPESVRRFFTSGALEETPKPGSIAGRCWTLLDADDLAEAARKQAEALGFHAVIDNTCDDWEYRAAAEYLLERLRRLRKEHERVCLISTGEVSVELPAKPMGFGGRNQHFALHVATLLDASDASTAVLSAGSDGIDGHSSAAGAVVDETTLRDGGVEKARKALEEFDSFTFLEGLGATVTTGATGNNLRDLRILLSER